MSNAYPIMLSINQDLIMCMEASLDNSIYSDTIFNG
jgi:hypothetical protein